MVSLCGVLFVSGFFHATTTGQKPPKKVTSTCCTTYTLTDSAPLSPAQHCPVLQHCTSALLCRSHLIAAHCTCQQAILGLFGASMLSFVVYRDVEAFRCCVRIGHSHSLCLLRREARTGSTGAGIAILLSLAVASRSAVLCFC